MIYALRDGIQITAPGFGQSSHCYKCIAFIEGGILWGMSCNSIVVEQSLPESVKVYVGVASVIVGLRKVRIYADSFCIVLECAVVV